VIVQLLTSGDTHMRRHLCAALVFFALPVSIASADGCHDVATKAMQARFGDTLGKRVYSDPNTAGLPIPATSKDATTLVVSGVQSYLYKGPYIGVVDGYKQVGQQHVRDMASAHYHASLRHCLGPVMAWHHAHAQHSMN
jgi:hypothetical protein